MRTANTSKLINDSGLRIRLFIFNLGPHKGDNDVINFFLTSDVSLDVDFFNESPPEVIDELNKSKFIGYASIIIIVNRTRKLCAGRIDRLLQALQSNRFLRYKSKVILCHYGIDGYDESAGVVLSSFLGYVEQKDDGTATTVNLHNFLYPRNFKRQQYGRIKQDLNRCYATRDYEHFNSSRVENTVIMQTFLPAHSNRPLTLDSILLEIFMNPFKSAQDLLSRGLPGDLRRSVVQTTINCDLYFYTINPALAIIINNYYFTDRQMRKGSERDVQHLLRELKVAGIPYILVEDCGHRELQQVLDYVAQKDFKPLKSLLLFLMSHGDADDVIYTHDGQLDIERDVVSRVEANKSLADADKLIVVNACRGAIDVEWADTDAIESIQSTIEGNHLARNTMLLYSVPNGVISPRCRTNGCPFIQSFCQHFRNTDPTDDIRLIDKKIDNDLSRIKYYEGLEKRSELVVRDAEQHHIRMRPMKALQMLNLIDSISNEFPMREADGAATMLSRFMYICGCLNKCIFHTGDLKDKYFAPELEYETCSLDDSHIGDG